MGIVPDPLDLTRTQQVCARGKRPPVWRAAAARNVALGVLSYQRPRAHSTNKHPPEEAQSCSSPVLVHAGEEGGGGRVQR